MFFAVTVSLPADEAALRKALDQLSASYADAQRQLREREAAVKALTESLAVARTESEMFQKLWTEAELRARTLGADVSEPSAAVQQRQFMETLRALYVAESERQRVIEQLQRLLAAIESDRRVAEEVQAARQLLAAVPATSSGGLTPATVGTTDSARVLDVSPQLRLVVLDVGSQQGVRVGMPFEVFRGARLVGRVRVVEVRQRVAGALIESVEQGGTFQAGDTARVTKN